MNLNNSDNVNDNIGINGFPISKSWIKPNYVKNKANKNNVSKEDKYFGKIKNNTDKFYSHDNEKNNKTKDMKNYSTIIKEESTDRKIRIINKKEPKEPIDLKKIEKHNTNFYIKKFNIKQPKLKVNINSERRETNSSPFTSPEIIKVIYDNKKEIMNLIILNDGNFCTSSWDSTLKYLAVILMYYY